MEERKALHSSSGGSGGTLSPFRVIFRLRGGKRLKCEATAGHRPNSRVRMPTLRLSRRPQQRLAFRSTIESWSVNVRPERRVGSVLTGREADTVGSRPLVHDGTVHRTADVR